MSLLDRFLPPAGVSQRFLTAVDLAAADCRETADLLFALADSIEQAQTEYRRRVGSCSGPGSWRSL